MDTISVSQSDLSRILVENDSFQRKITELQQLCTLKEMLLRVYRRIPLSDGQIVQLQKDVVDAINMVNGWYQTDMKG